MNNEEPSEQEPSGLEKPDYNNVHNTDSRRNQLSQSRSAVLSFVIILFVIYLLSIIVTIIAGEAAESGFFISTPILMFSFMLDVFLSINLLRGKKWARTWLLIRLFLGTIVFGGLSLFQGDYGSLILNTGVNLALILLLTGVSTRPRIIGSVSLAIVAALVGSLWPLMASFTTLPEVPETSIPKTFETYTSEGFFSISYPPDWKPNISIIQVVEEVIKEGLEDLDMGIQTEDTQLVFIGGEFFPDYVFPCVAVFVEPKTFWPLGTIVENTSQWAKNNDQEYVEYSRFQTTIGGRQAIIQTYQGSDVDSLLTGYTNAYIVAEKFVWTVSCMCDREDLNENIDTFNNIVRSLRVEY